MIVSNNTAYSFFVVTHSVRMIFFSSSSKLIMIINIIIMTRTTVLDSNEIKDRIGYINQGGEFKLNLVRDDDDRGT